MDSWVDELNARGGDSGLSLDRGWLRVLGREPGAIGRSIDSWNRLDGEPRLPGALLIADDAVGGFFAINIDRFRCPAGHVLYHSPDTCEWEDLDLGAAEFLRWAIAGPLDEFYRPFRWPTWETEVAELDGDRAIHIYPPLWVEGPPPGERSRKDVPLEELWGLYVGEYGKLLA